MVNDELDVLLIHPHPEGGGRDHDLYAVREKGVLVFDLLFGIHLPVVRKCRKAVPRETVGQILGRGDAVRVDDRRTVAALDEASHVGVLCVAVVEVLDLILEVFAHRRRAEHAKVNAQGALEIVADVLHDLRLRGGGEARDRNFAPDALLKLLQKLPDVEVVHAEVVAPGRKAVGFVDHEALDPTFLQRPHDRRRPQCFGRDVEKRRPSALDFFKGRLSFEQIDEPVDRGGGEDLLFLEIVHLVLHKGLQGRENDRESRRRAGRHERRQLEGDGLAAARREDREQRLARDGRRGRGFLQRLAVSVVDAKAVEAEIFLERRPEVRNATTVFALGIPAKASPQRLDDAVRFRVPVREPEGRGGKVRVLGLRNGDEGENTAEFHGMPLDEHFNRRGGTELSRENPPDFGNRVRQTLGLGAQEEEKARKTLHVGKEFEKDSPNLFGKSPPGVHEFEQTQKGSLGVRERIASVSRPSGRFLLECVTARARQQKRFKTERIENGRRESVEEFRTERHVAVDDVVPAHDVGPADKGSKVRRDAPAVVTVFGIRRSHVEAESRLGIDFEIERDDAQRRRSVRTVCIVGMDGTGIVVRARQNKSHGRVEKARLFRTL